MSVDVVTEIVIARPRAEVAALPAMERAVRRANQADLRRIKELLEP